MYIAAVLNEYKASSQLLDDGFPRIMSTVMGFSELELGGRVAGLSFGGICFLRVRGGDGRLVCGLCRYRGDEEGIGWAGGLGGW